MDENDNEDIEEENKEKLEKSKETLLNCIQLLTGSIEKLNNFAAKEEKIQEALSSVNKVNEEISQVCYIVETIENEKKNEFEKRGQNKHQINTLKLELRKQGELVKALEEENQGLLDEAEKDRLRLKELLEENEAMSEELKNAESGVKQKLEAFEAEKEEAESEAKKIGIKLKAAEKKNKWLWKTIDKFKEEKKELKQKIKDIQAAQSQIDFSPMKSEICESTPDFAKISSLEQSEIMQSTQIVENPETEKS